LAELIIRKRMIAVQGENTADVDDYQLKTSTFYEMSTYTLQKESNETTVQYVGVVLGPLKPRVSCQYPHFAQTEDIWLKSTLEEKRGVLLITRKELSFDT